MHNLTAHLSDRSRRIVMAAMTLVILLVVNSQIIT